MLKTHTPVLNAPAKLKEESVFKKSLTHYLHLTVVIGKNYSLVLLLNLISNKYDVRI